MNENRTLTDIIKKALLVILGLLQGAIGNYFGLLGLAFAFPRTELHSKDYDEDMFIVPFGYIMILAWIIVTISAFVFLRKNRANLLSFLIPWIIGLIGCLIAIKLY